MKETIVQMIRMRSLSLRWFFAARSEQLVRNIVWKLPHSLVYWSCIRVCANATTGAFSSEEAPGVTLDQILRRWDRREGGDPSFQ
jgi:hypothetical protein